MKENKSWETTSVGLHMIAMGAMLCDHLWGTIVPGNDWLTCLGRITFPIFAFLLVEGYFHTASVKKYAQRLLLWALISEIPFDLAMGSRMFYPIHQNVLWSFLISLGLIHWNEKAKQARLWRRCLRAAATVLAGCVLGLVTMVDFYHAGILMVLVFYFFRGNNWPNRLGQLVCLWYVNTEVLGGYGYELQLFGSTVFLQRQAFALLALIPIWMYRGRQGIHNRRLRWLYYGFYPAHLLVLGLLKLF